MARGIPGGIRVLDTGRLVVVPGDRHEVIMAAYLAELSETHLAALLLSAGTAPDPQVSQLSRATAAADLPVLLVESDSYQTATREMMRGSVSSSSPGSFRDTSSGREPGETQRRRNSG